MSWMRPQTGHSGAPAIEAGRRPIVYPCAGPQIMWPVESPSEPGAGVARPPATGRGGFGQIRW
eukprot:7287195-Pyramimonas_sp.AAC.1